MRLSCTCWNVSVGFLLLLEARKWFCVLLRCQPACTSLPYSQFILDPCLLFQLLRPLLQAFSSQEADFCKCHSRVS